VASLDDLQEVLFSADAIEARVAELAIEIERDFAERDLVVVGALTGSLLFIADLVRKLSLPLRLDFFGVSSYRTGTTSGELAFTKELALDVRERDVLVVDDILDTGRTLAAILQRLEQLAPRSVHTCMLLEKQARRACDVSADYVAFQIPDAFVVGYGLDFAEHYRNLPCIGVLKPEIYADSAS
jgi:hypoxanthine phosphoribosyltransferase